MSTSGHPTDNDSIQDTINTQEQPYRPSQHRYRIFWFWKWGLAALALAFGLVAAMFALLLSFNGQKTPDWGYSINLSTLLDLLAQIFCAAVGMIVAQIISQQKWAWFSGPDNRARPLHDLQDFDQGSRDSLGAALLIPKVLRHDITVALAALVMIIALAVGPFVQQAVQTTPCSYAVPGTNGSIPYAHYVPRQSIGYDGQNEMIEITGTPAYQLKTALYASLDGGSSAAENQITPSCSTGNCTFKGGDPIERSNGNAAGMMTTTDSGDGSGSFSTVAVCSSCVDVSSLVSFVGYHYDDYGPDFVAIYALPNGLNIEYSLPSNYSDIVISWQATYVNVSTDTDIGWIGDLLSPAHAQASRWAMVNMTFLTFSAAQCNETVTPQCPIPGKTNLALQALAPNKSAGPIAATCALYPCIRRYVSPSITNGVFQEAYVDSSKVWPTTDSYQASSLSETANALTGYAGVGIYAGIQSPCRVDDVIYTTQNMSTAPNATNLWFYETTINGTTQARNISGPEPCIYRHDGLFVTALSYLFQQNHTLFNTHCDYVETKIDCDVFPDADGSNDWIIALYNNGNATVSAVEAYLESFAIAMTNTYRSIFGASQYEPVENTNDSPLPLGEVQGIVWQDSVCTAARWGWLFLPVGLLLLTSILLAMTMARAWRLRRVQPVWKANVLPAILYKERFKDDNGLISSWPQGITAADITKKPLTNTNEYLDRLMDADEIKKATKNVMVRFGGNGWEQEKTHDEGSGQGWLRRRKRSISASDVDSLLLDS
ncbi:hypothetical protein VP1G_05089 [Cytospora mali]|uniref:Uncharacterized protein n=1 Tax=Cytospora mali TaxID=578113 RepID=A0A194V1G4_CYTMA|nr:hypothetical protein VP1G_05089 [Valsa mali var. pyri (nom. inval.)]